MRSRDIVEPSVDIKIDGTVTPVTTTARNLWNLGLHLGGDYRFSRHGS